MKGGVNVSKKEGRDYLYLVWKEPVTRRNYVVGQLTKNSQYEFSYGYEIKDAMEKGFELLISFEELEKVYKSDTLWPTFSSRLPDSKRRGIKEILAKYGLKEFDEYKLLKRSGARLPIDSLEFIDPIFKDDIRELAGLATGLLSRFNKLDDGTKKMIVKVAGLVAGIGPLLFGVNKYSGKT